MIEIILDRSEEVARWVASVMPFPGYERGFDAVSAIGCAENGKLIGGTVFHGYNPEAGTIEMSSAATSPRWLNRKMVNAIFTYVYDVAHCQCAIMQVAESNSRMRRIAERFGFDGFYIPRISGPREGSFIYTLTVEQWRVSPFNRNRLSLVKAA